MRKVKRWRYYCEFCKKSGASGGHMAAHERACTANPHRECGMCREAGLTQQRMEDLITALLCKGTDHEEGLKVLIEVAEGCPSCILAAIRQSKIQKFAEDEGEEGVYLSFNFKEAKKEFWDNINDDRDN